MSGNLECYAPNFGQDQGAMSATSELLAAKRERDEALDALRDLHDQLSGMCVHKSCYETAAEILTKHGRLPAAGGAE